MKNLKSLIFTCIALPLLFWSCNSVHTESISEYVPDDKGLYETIVALDKVYFDAYNNCDMEQQSAMYSDDIEFFHDKGGLMTSKQELLDAIEKNICGKVTRELVAGSIEVYPIKDYGAVQIGLHKFYNNQEPDAPSNPSKFITIWKNENGVWQMAKVISLH